jgi:hypothetical protein
MVVTMKRERLRRTLAWATLEELGPIHARTIPNIDRYVIPKRTKYRINKNEKITLADKLTALMIVQFITMQKPIAWSFGVGDDYTSRRKEAFMSTVLPVK